MKTVLVSALLFLATKVSAEPISLDTLSAYINGLNSAETTFTQYNGDGSRSKGNLYIQRPGRMRFEYNPPNEALVLASAGVVAIFDAKSNAEPQQFPLRRTPLNLILGKKVNLAGNGMVTQHFEGQGGMTVVVASDPKTPEAGSIELYFTADPVELTQWVITDESGSKTGVDLGPLDTTVEFPSWFFSVGREKRLRQN